MISFRVGESLHQSVLSKYKIPENFQKCSGAGVSRWGSCGASVRMRFEAVLFGLTSIKRDGKVSSIRLIYQQKLVEANQIS